MNSQFHQDSHLKRTEQKEEKYSKVIEKTKETECWNKTEEETFQLKSTSCSSYMCLICLSSCLLEHPAGNGCLLHQEMLSFLEDINVPFKEIYPPGNYDNSKDQHQRSKEAMWREPRVSALWCLLAAQEEDVWIWEAAGEHRFIFKSTVYIIPIILTE